MWVWIPRYVYRISSGWHTSTEGTIDIQFSKGVDDNWNKSVIGAIDLREGAVASDTATNGNKYTNHPAFTFGDTELTGFWLAKFEASSSNPSAQYGGSDDLTLKVKSVPNVVFWRGLYLENVYYATRAMETDTMYGWDGTGNGIDTHMMKNTEWGAMLYLAQSPYGKNDQVWPNNSSTYIAGCAGTSSTWVSYAGCQYAYSDTTYGVQASTTGNIYGIYDLITATQGKLIPAYINVGTYTPTATGLVNADSKYKDIYNIGTAGDTETNYDLTINHKGDAIYETSATDGNWYIGGISSMETLTNPFIVRRGNYCFDMYIGGVRAGLGITSFGFRPTLVVGAGL
jgi:hypothetical protein